MESFVELIEEHSSVLMTLAAVLSAFGAVGTALIAMHSLTTARNETTERQQPVMMAELRPAKNSHYAIDLVVKNVGPTVAREVEVTFDPPLDNDLAEKDGVSKFLIRRYERTIPSIAPGQALSNVWHSVRQQPGSTEMENVLNTPDNFTVRFTYRGLGKKKLEERYDLHVQTIKEETFSTSSSSIPGRLKSYDQSLKAIKNSIREISRKLS